MCSTSSCCWPLLTFRCSTRASRIWLPMLWTGESEDIGSWKIMPMRPPRSALISGPSRRRLAMSTGAPWVRGSANMIRPPRTSPLRGRRPITHWEMTVLPDPDSPTSANRFPGWNPKADTPHDFRGAALHGEADAKVLDTQDVGGGCQGRGRRNGMLPRMRRRRDGEEKLRGEAAVALTKFDAFRRLAESPTMMRARHPGRSRETQRRLMPRALPASA